MRKPRRRFSIPGIPDEPSAFVSPSCAELFDEILGEVARKAVHVGFDRRELNVASKAVFRDVVAEEGPFIFEQHAGTAVIPSLDGLMIKS